MTLELEVTFMWGVGLGFYYKGGTLVIILPFVIIAIGK